MIEFLFITFLLLLFGVFSKICDDFYDENIKPFTYAGVVFGFATGMIGAFMVSYSPILQATHIGPLAYWAYKNKIDCLGHKIATIMILIAFFLSFEMLHDSWNGIFFIFMGYLVSDIIKHRLKKFQLFFAYRLHFHLVCITYAIWISNIYGYLPLLCGLIGEKLVRVYYREYKAAYV